MQEYDWPQHKILGSVFCDKYPAISMDLQIVNLFYTFTTGSINDNFKN